MGRKDPTKSRADREELNSLYHKARNGDEDALQAAINLLAERFAPEVAKRVARRRGDQLTANIILDLTQEAVLRVMDRIKNASVKELRPEEQKDILVLFERQFRDEARNHVRRLSRKMGELKPRADSKAVTPGQRRTTEENLSALHHAIENELGPTEQFALRENLDGKSYKEIAARLGKNTDAVQKRAKRAIQKMENAVRKRDQKRVLTREILIAEIGRLPSEIREAVEFVYVRREGSPKKFAKRLGTGGDRKADVRIKRAYQLLRAATGEEFPQSFRLLEE